MPGALGLLAHQMGTLWKHFGINQKVSIILALLASLAVIGGIVYWSGRPDYRLLYSGLTLEDAARGREKLDEARIPVEIRDHGQALFVPAGDVYRARLMLAADGLPKDSSAGFELFEQPKFGLTEFAQQVNFQRALQGELERTIAAIDGVQSARVMLVMPRDRLFASEQDKAASASIMLSLKRGAQLQGGQIHSINQLVSTAVPGLSQGHITITDQQGRLLSDASQREDPLLGSSQRQLETRRAMEDTLARKAQDMLDLALGKDQAIVRVSADIDFRRIEKHNEKFDAEGRVLFRETISSENSSEPTRSPATGTARVAVGDPAATVNNEQTAMGKMKREDIDSEYRVPSERETVLDQGGRVTRLSVAVSVAARSGEPRNAVEIDNIKQLIRSAVGAISTADRKDEVSVIEMAFNRQPDSEPAWQWWERLPFSVTGSLRTVGGIVLLITLYLFSRRTFRQLSVERETVGTPVSMLTGAEGGAHSLGAGSDDPAMLENETPLDTVSRLAEQSPSTVATWIDHAVRSKS